MAKKKNLLNNLLRVLRKRAFPEETIAQVAAKLTAEKVPTSASYLAKAENGDLEKPTEKHIDKIAEVYRLPFAWQILLGTVWGRIEAGEPVPDAGEGETGLFYINEEKDVAVKAIFPGPIPAAILSERKNLDIIVTVPAILATFARYGWIHERYAQSRFYEILQTGTQVRVLRVEHTEECTDLECITYCLDDTLVIFNPGPFEKHTADEEEVADWLTNFKQAKAKCYLPQQAFDAFTELLVLYEKMRKWPTSVTEPTSQNPNPAQPESPKAPPVAKSKATTKKTK